LTDGSTLMTKITTHNVRRRDFASVAGSFGPFRIAFGLSCPRHATADVEADGHDALMIEALAFDPYG
jgi:hypothetical protein